MALAPLACGGGGSAGSDFCHSWATAFCHRIYQCPPADGPSPLAGTSEANCTEGWTAACANPPPSGESFDINCSGGETVNAAAKTSCLNTLTTVSCAQFNGPDYTDTCAQVCPQSTTDGGGAGTGGETGTGGTVGAGTAGTGDTGGSGPAGTSGAAGAGAAGASGAAGAIVTGAGGAGGAGATASADVMTACQQFESVACDQAFACFAPADQDSTFTAEFGATLADCKTTVVAAACADAATTCGTYSQALATACLQKTIAETCDDFLNTDGPPECMFVCQ
jgi:collagen type I alpha